MRQSVRRETAWDLLRIVWCSAGFRLSLFVLFCLFNNAETCLVRSKRFGFSVGGRQRANLFFQAFHRLVPCVMATADDGKPGESPARTRHCKPDEAAKPLGSFSREGADEEEGKPGDRSAAVGKGAALRGSEAIQGWRCACPWEPLFLYLRRGGPRKGGWTRLG